MRNYTITFHHGGELVEAEGLGEAFAEARARVLANPKLRGFEITRSVDESGEDPQQIKVSYHRDPEDGEPLPDLDQEGV